jgi:hypothetical protein
LRSSGRHPARDSDVKRKILEERPDFDEAELGFAKFSKFLAQAEEHGIVRTERGEAGLEVMLTDDDGGRSRSMADTPVERGPAVSDEREKAQESPVYDDAPEPTFARSTPGPMVYDVQPSDDDVSGLGPRRGSTRRRGTDEPPPLFHGQTVAGDVSHQGGEGGAPAATAVRSAPEAPVRGAGLEGLGLPSEPDAIIRYLAHRYKGVGEKTAETLVETFGAALFATLRDDPEAVARVIPAGRAEQLLEAWNADYERRTSSRSVNGGGEKNGGRRGRGRGRSRGDGRD